MVQVADLSPTSFAEHTSLRVGGDVSRWIATDEVAAAIEIITECSDLGISCLVVGGGTNLVCADEPFEGCVVQLNTRGIDIVRNEESALVTFAAGENWDDVVAATLDEGMADLAPLSGIPGLVGATPVQNVGAYGTEISQILHSVDVWDRMDRELSTMSARECDLRYRSSIFKNDIDRFLITSVTFRLTVRPTASVRYDQLANSLGVGVGDDVSGADIREAVLELRRSKAMVLSDEDRDTWSIGSFFLNPLVDETFARALPAECPRYPAGGAVKVSAAWLLEASGVAKGWRTQPDSDAQVSTKHVLAVTNRGTASTGQIIELAHVMRDRVQESFDIELVPEPRFVNCSW